MAQDKKTKNKGLGRGLSALLSSTDKEYANIALADDAGTAQAGAIRADKDVPIEFLVPNPNQPRKTFDDEKAKELVDSIKEKGVLQPILVRPIKGGDNYEIIAGERRWRAAQAAGLHKLPVIVKDLSDVEALEIAIIENVQRHDLSPIEEALGYKRLMDEFGHTQEILGKIVGKSRSHIANILRLLVLPEKVRTMLAAGQLSMGHARALITADDPDALAARIVKEGLSVRQTEALAKQAKQGDKAPTIKVAPKKKVLLEKDPDTLALENELSLSLGVKVSIDFHADETGELRLQYKSLEQLDDLCQRLNQTEDF